MIYGTDKKNNMENSEDSKRNDSEYESCIKAHDASVGNEETLKESETCGCFFCGKVFSPSEITKWVREPDGGRTAVCPFCGVDSIIGDKAGYQINAGFLRRMNDVWF